MMNFRYLARDPSGVVRRGSLGTHSALSLRTELSNRGMSLLSFVELSDKESQGEETQSRWSLSYWIPPRSLDIQIAIDQMSLMLRNGIGLIKALEAVGKQSHSRQLARKLNVVKEEVLGGIPLSAAAAKHRLFPDIVLQLMEVGESTGDLPAVLDRASKQIAFQRKNWLALSTALAYPLFAVTAAILVSIYLVVKVIPELNKFLSSMGRKLPQMTQTLMDVSHWLQANGITSLWLGLGSCGMLYWIYRQPRGRLAIDRALLRVPIVGPIIRTAGTIAFASSLSVMMRSGLPLLKSLSASERLHRNRYLAMQVLAARIAVERGSELAKPLGTPYAYMPLLSSMVAVAEQTGQLDQVLEQVASFYDEQLQAMIKRLSAWMEPMMIVIVGGLVGYVYMAFFVALMSAGGTVR